MDVESYLEKRIGSIFEIDGQLFLDTGAIDLLNRDAISYLMNRGEYEKLASQLSKCTAYNLKMNEIIKNGNVFTTRGIILELLDGRDAFKRYMKWLEENISKNSKNKAILNLVKESLRGCFSEIDWMANLFYKRLLENKNGFNKELYKGFKSRLEYLFRETKASHNDKDLVHLFINQAAYKPASIFSRDGDIEKLVNILIANKNLIKTEAKKNQFYLEKTRLQSPLYTSTALAYIN